MRYPNPERELIKEVITLCKLILVNPATSAAGERSFPTARKSKTWLRSRMKKERFSNLTVLNTGTKRERTGFPPLTSQTNLPTATQTESVILALFG